MSGGCEREEVTAVRPLDSTDAGESQVRFVHQARSVQGLPRPHLRQTTVRDSMQFVVQDANDFIQGLTVAVSVGLQERSDVSVVVHV